MVTLEDFLSLFQVSQNGSQIPKNGKSQPQESSEFLTQYSTPSKETQSFQLGQNGDFS